MMPARETYFLVIPAPLRALFQSAADREGLSLAAWLREAGAEHLEDCKAEEEALWQLAAMRERKAAAVRQNGLRGAAARRKG
jgi:hypothetical protein